MRSRSISVKKKIAYIGVGSNSGMRRRNCVRAVGLLKEIKGTRLVALSGLYLTEPVGVSADRWFVNCVVGAETSLSPFFFFKELQKVERTLGRKRPYPGAPRTMDLDLLFYNGLVLLSDVLKIPHPRVGERRFVLMPLSEIASDFQDPVTGLTVKEMVKQCPDRYEVRLLAQAKRELSWRI